MRRMPLLAVLALAAASTAPAAQADSTTTQTLPQGGTMRSSQDASPSPANPVIVSLTNAQDPPSCQFPPCQQDSTFTITLKDAHDRARGDGIEGPNGFDFVGPQVDITASDPNARVRLAFDVDASAYAPGFSGNGPHQFACEHLNPSGQLNPAVYCRFDAEKLADGDVRLTFPRDQHGNDTVVTGSFDLLEQSFYVNSGYDGGKDKGSLQTALSKGVAIDFSGNYAASVKAKITVSPSVARRLRLNSTTIGAKSFPTAPKGSARIKLTSAARKALKKYKKVVVYVETVHTGPGGQIKTKKSKATLTTKRDEDDELG
jgi:hypothetical protein